MQNRGGQTMARPLSVLIRNPFPYRLWLCSCSMAELSSCDGDDLACRV